MKLSQLVCHHPLVTLVWNLQKIGVLPVVGVYFNMVGIFVLNNVSRSNTSHLVTFCVYKQNQNGNFLNIITYILSRYELRRCVRTRTHAMCGPTCACVCKIHFEKCAGCACVRLVFGRAMCDHTLYSTLLHFFVTKMAIYGPKLLFHCHFFKTFQVG